MAELALARRPQEATTWPELTQYFTTRARQLWHEGWRWSETLSDVGVGCRTEFTSRAGEKYASYYVLAQYHGQGHFRKLVGNEALPVVTITDCHIEQVLDHLGARYVRAGSVLDSAEYRLVEAVLGDSRGSPGDEFLMNHVDEGLAVLADLDTSDLAFRAYCLLPLVSDEASFVKYHSALEQVLEPIPAGRDTLALAIHCSKVMRAGAQQLNNALAKVPAGLSSAVVNLLVAKYVRRKKALEADPARTYDSAELDAQYQCWLERLGVAGRYHELRDRLPQF